MRSHLRDRTYLHAVAVLVGAMIGAGIFALPFVFAQSGFVLGALWLVFAALLTVVFDTAFARLALATRGDHQLSGYVGAVLGSGLRRLTSVINIISLYGALLAYIILLSQWLGADRLGVVVALGLSLVWYLRVRTIAGVELFTLTVVVLGIGLLFALSAPHIAMANLVGWEPGRWYAPVGVLFFAFAGLSSVPIARQVLRGRERLLRPAIRTAVCVAAACYLVFIASVVGVSGMRTLTLGVDGLTGTLLGLVVVSTSFVALGTALFENFRLEYRMRPLTSWLAGIGPPLIMFAAGFRNVIGIIGVVGGGAVIALSLIVLVASFRV